MRLVVDEELRKEFERKRDNAFFEDLYGCKNCKTVFSLWFEESTELAENVRCPLCGGEVVKVGEYDLLMREEEDEVWTR